MGKKKNKGPSKAQLRLLADILLCRATLEERSQELERLGIPLDLLEAESLSPLVALVKGAAGEDVAEAPLPPDTINLKALSPLMGGALVEALYDLKALPYLVELSQSAPNKALRRDAKGALRRLAQQGAEIPTSAAQSGSYRPPSYTLRAAMSGVDHLGRQMVSMLIQEPGEESLLCVFLFNEALGVEDASLQATTAGSFTRDFLRRAPESTVRMVEVAPSHALYVFDRALEKSREVKRPVPFDIIQALQKAKAAFPPGAASIPGAATVLPLSGEGAKPAYERLLTEPEVFGWQPAKAAIEAGMMKLGQAVRGPVVVGEALKRQRMEDALREGATEYFTSEERKRWAYRLNAAALVFAATNRPEVATIALGFAKSVADTAIFVREIPFLSDLYAGHVIMGLQEMFGPGAGDKIPMPGSDGEASQGEGSLIIPG